MKLAPFTTSVLKEIISDHKADYTKDDLLALYTFTGGVPKYIEQLWTMDVQAWKAWSISCCNPIHPF